MSRFFCEEECAKIKVLNSFPAEEYAKRMKTKDSSA